MSFNKAKAVKTASKYVQQGKYQAAIEEYRKIIQAEPSDITTLNTLGDLCVKAGDTEEAIRSFVRIAEHYRTGGFNLKAIAMFKKVNKLDPANVEIALKLAALYAQQKLMADARHQYLAVAENYLRTGQNKQALGIYQKIADLDPENTTIQIKLAEAYLREQQLDQSYEAFIAAAGELQRQGKMEEALQTYLKALKTNPEGQIAFSAAVNLYIQRGEPQRAVALINHLLSLKPDDAELLTLLGRVHQSANELDEAEEAIVRAIELDSSRFQYLLDLASFFARSGDLDRALRQLDRVLEVLHERREEDKAIALLHEVVARDPNHFGALERLAAIYSRIREDHNLIETLNSLADAGIRKGEDEVAINALRQLVQLEPDEIKHRRRLRSLGLSDEDMQRLNAPSFAPAEMPQAAPAVPSQRISEFEVTHAPSAVSWDDSLAGEFETHYQAPAAQISSAAPMTEAEGEFEVSVARTASSYDFSFSDEEMVDGAEVEPRLGNETAGEEEIGFGNISPEIDLSDELIATSSQSFLESYLAEEDGTAEVELSGAAMNGQPPMTIDSSRPATQNLETVHWPTNGAGHPIYDAGGAEQPAPSAQAYECRTGAFESMMPDEQEEETIFIIPAVAAEATEDLRAQLGASFGELETKRSSTPADEIDSAPSFALPAQTVEKSGAQQTQTHSPFDDLLDEFNLAAFDFEDKAPERGAQLAATYLPEATSGAQAGSNELLGMLNEFKSGVEQSTSIEDFETHYQLGLAYKEMEMFDEAIEEFQQAFKAISSQPSSQNYLLCCSMLGFCFAQKDLPRLAVMWFKKGLETTGRSEDEYQALRYDLATAYAHLGDLERAFDTFSEVYAIDINYRGVMLKMRELQEQMTPRQ